MKPPIKIGLYTQSPIEMSVWKVILQTHGYRVFDHHRPDEAIDCAILEDVRCFLIIRCAEHDGSEELAESIRKMNHHMKPKVIFIDRLADLFSVGVDAFFAGRGAKNWNIIDSIKSLTERKRGPRPMPVTAQRAMEAVCR
jgi:hypothetical protein